MAWRGAAWKIAAFAGYAVLNAVSRYLSGGTSLSLSEPLPVTVIIFFQDLFALLFLVPWIVGHFSSLTQPKFIHLHLVRVIFSAIAVISWYLALFFMPQAEAVALSVIGPMLGVIGAKWFLKESISGKRLSIICITFSIAVICMHPIDAFWGNQNNSWGLLYVGVSAVGFAFAKLTTRKLASLDESPQKLTAYLLFLIVPISLVPAAFVWVTPDLSHLPWLMLAGLLTAFSIYAVSVALSYSEVSFLAPFDFIRFIFNVSIGYVVFMELPSPWTLWVILAAIIVSLGALPFKLFKSIKSRVVE